MKIKAWLLSAFVAMLVVVPGGNLLAQSMMKAPSIEGTYKFVSRTTPDGKTVKSPDVVGLQTFTKTYRNFNVAWKTPDGKRFALAISSTYTLTATTYTETLMSSVMIDELTGKGIVTSTTPETKTSPVTMDGGKVTFKLPFDPPVATFDGNKLTAVAEGMFTDFWEKVK